MGIAEAPGTVENPEAAEINEIAETHASVTNKATTGAREKIADPEKTKGAKTAEATDPAKTKTGMETIPIGKRDRGTEIGKTKANGKGVITDPVKTNEATVPKRRKPPQSQALAVSCPSSLGNRVTEPSQNVFPELPWKYLGFEGGVS